VREGRLCAGAEEVDEDDQDVLVCRRAFQQCVSPGESKDAPMRSG
jgi:hypothetical protein